LRLHPEAAANLAVAQVPTFNQALSAADARAQLRTANFEAIDAVLIVDDGGRFAGAANLKDLLQAPDEVPLSAVLIKDWPVASPETDQEHVADLAHQHKVPAIPVIGANGKPLGLIPAMALLEILAQEHHEDVHRLAGILKQRAGARHALDDRPLSRAGQRLPWLLVGLALSTGATAMMVSFEHALKANIIISFFIPALVYLADAVGTQTEAIVVRALSLRTRPLGPLLVAEVATGALIGLPLALLAFFGIWLFFQDFRLAIGVAVALFAASTMASVLGLLLPWLLARLGTDPAFGSGPVATVIQDVLTIAIYFAVMTAVISA
jgi:magnesium transporter